MYADPNKQRDVQVETARRNRGVPLRNGTGTCPICRRSNVALLKDGYNVRQHKNLIGDWCQ